MDKPLKLTYKAHVKQGTGVAWEDVNYPRIDPGLYDLKNVVSRKKQLLPLITQLIQTAIV